MTSSRHGKPVKFALVGILNTLVGLSVIYGCKWALNFGDLAANICGYAVGLTFSFTLNRSWTFRHSGPMFPAMKRFLVIFVVAYLINLVTLVVAINALGINSYIGQLMGIVTYTTFFYLGSEYFTFRSAEVDPK